MRNLSCLNNDSGVALVTVALFLVTLLLLLGLGIDIGYVYLVKGQLQAAADAGALAGAGEIYPPNDSPPPSTFPPPDFDAAKVAAQAFVEKNKAGGGYLSGKEIQSIESGFWSLEPHPSSMHPSSTAPAGICSGNGTACSSNGGCPQTEVCLIQDVPAVSVTVSKTVPTFFAKVVGIPSFQPKATAVAVRGFPRTGHPFPLAVSKCMVDGYLAHPSDPPSEIVIWGAYSGAPNCNTGQWTSLTLFSNNAEDIRKLMYAVTEPVNIGEDIQIVPGTKDTLYHSIQKDFIGQVVQVPVVLDPMLNTNSRTPVTGFMRFRIDRVIGSGSNSQIAGHFVAYYADDGTEQPGGGTGNSVTPPALVK